MAPSVRLLTVSEGVLEIAEVDIVDGTPLLGVEPYVPEFDAYRASKAGWFDKPSISRRSADGRFCLSVPEP